jgi:hypothetical protein
MTIVLLAAMIVSFSTMDWIAGGVIAALVILNVSVGFSQVSLLLPGIFSDYTLDARRLTICSLSRSTRNGRPKRP